MEIQFKSGQVSSVSLALQLGHSKLDDYTFLLDYGLEYTLVLEGTIQVYDLINDELLLGEDVFTHINKLRGSSRERVLEWLTHSYDTHLWGQFAVENLPRLRWWSVLTEPVTQNIAVFYEDDNNNFLMFKEST